ncbi:MAG: hypothetical protein WCQ50_20955, partial [Spirochaetota bacterium]
MSETAVKESLTVGQRITEAISVSTVFTIDAFGYKIPITDSILWSWVVIVILMIMGVISVFVMVGKHLYLTRAKKG